MFIPSSLGRQIGNIKMEKAESKKSNYLV